MGYILYLPPLYFIYLFCNITHQVTYRIPSTMLRAGARVVDRISTYYYTCFACIVGTRCKRAPEGGNG